MQSKRARSPIIRMSYRPPRKGKAGQCSEPSRGPTGTAGKTPRRRDGSRQDGTASRRPVVGEACRGLQGKARTAGPYTLGLSK